MTPKNTPTDPVRSESSGGQKVAGLNPLGPTEINLGKRSVSRGLCLSLVPLGKSFELPAIDQDLLPCQLLMQILEQTVEPSRCLSRSPSPGGGYCQSRCRVTTVPCWFTSQDDASHGASPAVLPGVAGRNAWCKRPSRFSLPRLGPAVSLDLPDQTVQHHSRSHVRKGHDDCDRHPNHGHGLPGTDPPSITHDVIDEHEY